MPELTSPELPTAEDTRSWGVRLGRLLAAGDLVVLTGGLGAGKTTLTQGIAEGVDVRGPITSPTFVIARVHPSLVGGPALVHVDAYRLGGFAELDDLDLDTSLEESVTVVEWGHGLAEDLADDRLEVTLSGEDTRQARIQTHGARWADADLSRHIEPTLARARRPRPRHVARGVGHRGRVGARPRRGPRRRPARVTLPGGRRGRRQTTAALGRRRPRGSRSA